MFEDHSEFELSPIDYEILKFINKHSPVHKEKIFQKFPENIFSTKHRIKNLSRISVYYMYENYIPLGIEDGIPQKEELGTYSLTEKGKKVTQDYILKCKIQRKEDFWKIFPIIVSVIALLKSFDKQLISIWQWLMQLMK